jgi:AhpD family alkylhydroperoxidase
MLGNALDAKDKEHALMSHNGTDRKHAMEAMKAIAPDIARAFGPFFQALMKDGALSVKQKELIAVGIAVAVRCEPCIEAHVEKCRNAGATAKEIMEAAGVAVLMGGGPGYSYASFVAAALQRLESGVPSDPRPALTR